MEIARFIKDIERCPYVPRDPEYDEWIRRDQQRLAKINQEYDYIYKAAQYYLQDKNFESMHNLINNIVLQLMCKFVIEMLRPR